MAKTIGNLIYPELSYSIVGCAYRVFKELGYGHPERVYQKALAMEFQKQGLGHIEQYPVPVFYQDKVISMGFADFLVEGKIVVEIKRGGRFSMSHVEQVNKYLVATDIRLCLLINFASNGAKCYRIINLNNPNPA